MLFFIVRIASFASRTLGVASEIQHKIRGIDAGLGGHSTALISLISRSNIILYDVGEASKKSLSLLEKIEASLRMESIEESWDNRLDSWRRQPDRAVEKSIERHRKKLGEEAEAKAMPCKYY